ncbi:MAG: hypothetical protein L2C94_006375 [Aigarchaeota archaeon]|nr:hypothetical protein [Candidatus Wolframiiraptor gerlachensis]
MLRRYRGLEERFRLYDEVMRLRELGLGYNQIARVIEERYGVSLSTGMICNWVRGRYHPLERCNRIVGGPGLAYVISGWLGDGKLGRDKRNYKHYVKLGVSDYDFVEEWGRCLAEALGRSKPYKPRWDDKYERWEVRGSSILLYSLLKRAKGDPWILMPYLEKYPREACRGFFDAEGWVDVAGHCIGAGNTDPGIINLFNELLGKLGINCKVYRRRRKDLFFISPRTGKVCRRNSKFIIHLVIFGEENILRFAEEVGFTIARKRAALTELVRRYRGC